MLVFATPRLGAIDESEFEEVYEPYLSTCSLPISDLSPGTPLNRSLSARLRRRERVQCDLVCMIVLSTTAKKTETILFLLKSREGLSRGSW